MFTKELVKKYVDRYLEEDGLYQNFGYLHKLPSKLVNCELKIKSDLVLAGLPVFFEVFNSYWNDNNIDYRKYLESEGKEFKKSDQFSICFQIPFDLALSLERTALNLLNRMSSIATTTKKAKEIIGDSIEILDTRKTTPGLRVFEKYAVRVGGGKNHRFEQTDVFMIKDNHKNIFGGVKGALEFFKSVGSFYNPLVLEVHSISELKEAIDYNIKHVMLDNFSRDEILEAIKIKKPDMTYEVSGGVNLDNLNGYKIEGVDAISMGMLTHSPVPVDLSLKYYNEH